MEKYRKEANIEKIAKKHAEIYDETLQEYREAHGTVKKAGNLS